jgi:hypothetical protein
MSRPRASRTVALLVAASAGFGFGVVGTEATFGHLRAAPEAPLLYSIELRDHAGALLANPMLVGAPGEGVHLSLAQGAQPAPANEVLAQDALPSLQMSLDLSPEPRRAGDLNEFCMGFRLSIDDGAAHQGALHAGRIMLALGETRSVELSEGGEQLHLELTVARAGSKAYDTLLRKRRARPLT